MNIYKFLSNKLKKFKCAVLDFYCNLLKQITISFKYTLQINIKKTIFISPSSDNDIRSLNQLHFSKRWPLFCGTIERFQSSLSVP